MQSFEDLLGVQNQGGDNVIGENQGNKKPKTRKPYVKKNGTTLEMIFGYIRQMQKYYGLTKDQYPSIKQIHAYAEDHFGCPSDRTMLRIVGPRMLWRFEFEKAGLEEPLLTKVDVKVQKEQGRRPKTTVALLYCCLRVMQEENGLKEDEWPTVDAIRSYGAKYSGFPASYETYYSVLGRRSGWRDVFVAAGLIAPKA